MASATLLLVLSRHTPRELDFRGIYLPPLLPATVLGLLAAWFTAQQLSRMGLARHFEQPLLAFLAFTLIYTVVFATVLFPS